MFLRKLPPWGWLMAGATCRVGLVALFDGELGDE